MLYFKSREFGKTLSGMLIKDLWRFERKGEARDILSLTGPGFFARSVLNMGLVFSGDNLERRVEAGGSASPVYRTPYGRVAFLGNEHFKGLRASANMKLSKAWSEKGIASDWRSFRFGGVK